MRGRSRVAKEHWRVAALVGAAECCPFNRRWPENCGVVEFDVSKQEAVRVRRTVLAGGVFINYRRDDSPAYAGWLHDQLVAKFGADRIFRDVDAIEPGLDFIEILNDQVAKCDVLIAIIGPGWQDAKDDDGTRRLDDPHDFVRIELEAALERKIRIVPVLVDGASMPRASTLPDSLQMLTRRNAITVSHERFRTDTAPLVAAIERSIEEQKKRRRTMPIAEGVQAILSSRQSNYNVDAAVPILSSLIREIASFIYRLRVAGTPIVYWVPLLLIAFFPSYAAGGGAGAILYWFLGQPRDALTLCIIVGVAVGLFAFYRITRWLKRKWFTPND